MNNCPHCGKEEKLLFNSSYCDCKISSAATDCTSQSEYLHPVSGKPAVTFYKCNSCEGVAFYMTHDPRGEDKRTPDSLTTFQLNHQVIDGCEAICDTCDKIVAGDYFDLTCIYPISDVTAI